MKTPNAQTPNVSPPMRVVGLITDKDYAAQVHDIRTVASVLTAMGHGKATG